MKKVLFFCLLAIALVSAEVQQNVQIFTDSRDGKKYKIVKIGTQTWMAENLNYNAEGSKCAYNQITYCDNYGRLYDWNTAMKVCPKGWHLPTNEEWELLKKSVGDSNTAGKHLKATSDWEYGGNGLDTYGFAALPGGSNQDGNFYSVGYFGSWWSASEGNASVVAYHWYMGFDRDIMDSMSYLTRYLYSVRCLQN